MSCRSHYARVEPVQEPSKGRNGLREKVLEDHLLSPYFSEKLLDSCPNPVLARTLSPATRTRGSFTLDETLFGLL